LSTSSFREIGAASIIKRQLRQKCTLRQKLLCSCEKKDNLQKYKKREKGAEKKHFLKTFMY